MQENVKSEFITQVAKAHIIDQEIALGPIFATITEKIATIGEIPSAINAMRALKPHLFEPWTDANLDVRERELRETARVTPHAPDGLAEAIKSIDAARLSRDDFYVFENALSALNRKDYSAIDRGAIDEIARKQKVAS